MGARQCRSLNLARSRPTSLKAFTSQVLLPGAAAAALVATATGAAGAQSVPDASTPRAHALRAPAEALQTGQRSAWRSADLAERRASAQRASRDREHQSAQVRAAAKAAAAARANAHRWVLPIAEYRLSSNYGPRWGRMHAGIDFAAPVGDRLVAMHAGTVTFAGQQSGYGGKVEIRYTDGTVSIYGHMSSISVRVGQRVAAGQPVGRVGSTGHSTGPHLHLEIHPHGGGPVDPYPWLVAKGLRP